MPTPAGELLLLVPTTSYRLDDFQAAARRLGVPLVVGSDLCHKIEDTFGAQPDLVPLDYRHPERAAEQIVEVAAARPIRGIVPASDPTAVIAALAAERLGLPHNPPEAARRAANKRAMRAALPRAGVPVPRVPRCSTWTATRGGGAGGSAYPCVLKPLIFSASRGVIRADDPPASSPRGGGSRRILATRAGAAAARGGRAPSDPGRGVRPGRRGRARGAAARRRARGAGALRQAGSARRPVLRGDDLRHARRGSRRALQARDRRGDRGRRRALGLREGPIHAELRLERPGPRGDRDRGALDRRALLADAPVRRRAVARGGPRRARDGAAARIAPPRGARRPAS